MLEEPFERDRIDAFARREDDREEPLPQRIYVGAEGNEWSYQDLVETLPAGLVDRLELLRAEPSEVAVTPDSIVEGIDVVGHVCDRELAVLVDLFLDSLLLQAAEEGLGDGVVPAIAFPAHTRFEMIRTAESTPRIASELGSLIGVDQGAAWSSSTYDHEHRIENELAMNRGLRGSADD